jgi:hypothetical protein
MRAKAVHNIAYEIATLIVEKFIAAADRGPLAGPPADRGLRIGVTWRERHNERSSFYVCVTEIGIWRSAYRPKGGADINDAASVIGVGWVGSECSNSDVAVEPCAVCAVVVANYDQDVGTAPARSPGRPAAKYLPRAE